MIKICTKCNLEKDVEEFYEYTHQNGRKYRKSVCKTCFAKLAVKYSKVYYSKPEVMLASNAKRIEKLNSNPELRTKKSEQAKRSYHKNIESNLLQRAKQRSIVNELEFNIDITDIHIPSTCPILEIPLFIGTRGDYKNSPSLDRVDTTKGYIKGNVEVISTLANTMKNSATFNLLRKFSKNIDGYIDRHDIVQTIGKSEPIELQDKEPVG